MILMTLSADPLLPKGGFPINLFHVGFLIQGSTTGYHHHLCQGANDGQSRRANERPGFYGIGVATCQTYIMACSVLMVLLCAAP